MQQSVMFDLAQRMGENMEKKACNGLFRKTFDSLKEGGYTLRKDKVDINGRRIKYKDFFKVAVDQATGDLVWDSNGVDAMSFAVFGLCYSLVNNGFMFEQVAGKAGRQMLFDCMSMYFESSGELGDPEEVLRLRDRFDLYARRKKFSGGVSDQDYENADRKSLFFAGAFGLSALTTGSSDLHWLLPRVMTFALKDDAEKLLADIFCRFRYAILGTSACEESAYCYGGSGKIRIGTDRYISSLPDVSVAVAQCIAAGLVDEEVHGESVFLYNAGDDDAIKYLKGGGCLGYIRKIEKKELERVRLGNIAEKKSDIAYYDCGAEDLWGSCFMVREGINAGLSASDILNTSDSYNKYLHHEIWYTYMMNESCRGFMDSMSRAIAAGQEARGKGFGKGKENAVEDCKKYASENKALHKEIAKLRGEVERLKKSVEAKSVMADKCKAKVSDMENKLAEMKSKMDWQEEVYENMLAELAVQEEVQDVGIPLSDIVANVNGFRVCIVGGRDDFGEKLAAFGLKNFVRAGSPAEMQRLGKFDFSVVMTSFVSHKMVFYLMSVLGQDRGRNLYFNGTNVEAFLRGLYAHILGYSGGQ